MIAVPHVTDATADNEFYAMIDRLGLNAKERFIGGYVDYEWKHARHLLQTNGDSFAGKRVLEVGANVGATSITLALLGAEICGVDVDPAVLEIAACNVRRYGVENAVSFRQTSTEHAGLPFGDAEFDLVCCNSVLEYVRGDLLRPLLREIDRVLRPGGVVQIIGTSNRLQPREIHTRRWFINYLPQVDPTARRGVWPMTIRRTLKGYADLDARDGGKAYHRAKKNMGSSPLSLTAIAILNRILTPFGVSAGHIAPSMNLRLAKPGGKR